MLNDQAAAQSYALLLYYTHAAMKTFINANATRGAIHVTTIALSDKPAHSPNWLFLLKM